MARRYCPLCDAPAEGAQCPSHRVPTIDVEGPRGPIERLEVGTVLVGRYRIDGLLQQGGMGVLLEATRLEDGDVVVVKVLKGQRVHDLANVRRFYQEARVASSLDHPNVVRILEFGVDQATRAPFLVMELVVGRTLKALVAREGGLPELRAARLFAQISRALVAAHAKGVLHRDLKPSNIMVHLGDHAEEAVKVLDFGLAKILDDPSVAPLTQPGKTVGTPAFMSPEQVTQRPQDHRSDLYGLGCVLYAALTGRPPFVADDLVAVMRMQMRTPPPRLPVELADGAPPSEGLTTLYRALMQKDPADRPASTEAVAEAFEALLGAGEPSSQADLRRSSTPVATLVDAPALPDTEPSLEALVARLPSVASDSDPTALEAEDDSSDDLRTTPDAPGLPSTEEAGAQTERGPVFVDDAEIDDAETPLVVNGLELSSAASASDDVLTTVLPQGLDEPSPTPAELDEEGPVLGASLLVPRPWPTDARATLPLEPAYAAPARPGASAARPASGAQRGEIAAKVAVEAVDRGASAADPAERAARPAPRPTRQLMFGAWVLAALLVALAAGVVWLRAPPPSNPETEAGARPPAPAVRPGAAPRAQPRTATQGIRIESEPDGAKVEVDGMVRGRTPLWVPRPARGTARLRVVREGYRSEARTLSPSSESPVRIVLEPRR